MLERAVITGDQHLVSRIWSRFPSIREDSYMAFEAVCDVCVEQEAHWLLLLGDIHNSVRMSSEPVVRFVRSLDRLRRRLPSCRVGFILGNHDAVDPPWPELAGAENLDGRLTTICGRQVYGLRWQPAEELAETLKAGLPGDTLLAHQSWEELKGIRPEGILRELPPNFRTVFSGDMHECLEVEYRPGEWGYSPGNTYIQRISEPPDKYVLLWDGVTVKRQSLPGRKRYEFVVNTEQEAQDLLVGYQNHGSDDLPPKEEDRPLIVLRVAAAARGWAGPLEEELSNHGYVWLYCDTDQEAEQQQEAQESGWTETSLIREVGGWIDEQAVDAKVREAAKQLAAQLLAPGAEDAAVDILNQFWSKVV